MKLAFTASSRPEAQEALQRLRHRYGEAGEAEADIIVALGGDGHMLDALRRRLKDRKPVYGMNRGTIGFLMNEFREEGLYERIAAAQPETIRPLEMHTVSEDGSTHSALAINEVSIFRQSYQAVKVRVWVDGKLRMDELICDGLMVATPAGSTAYNLSAQGPILPLDAPLLALTPVSPFRPRRWRGALLSDKAEVRFELLEVRKRPANAVADHTEVKSVVSVTIREAASTTATLLFDPDHSWNERILTEQFRY